MQSKLYSVQYLRGLAALTVLIAHAWAHPFVVPSMDAERLGQLGVAMFFVISGFIMVTITGEGRFSARDFLVRRIIRIVPLYWLFTTAVAILAGVLPFVFKSTVFTWPHYLLSMLFIPHEAPVRGGTSPLLSLGWTLNYEAWFYLCFAALAVFAARRRVLMLSILFLALFVLGLFVHSGDGVLAFYTDFAPLGFCAGAWLGLLATEGRLSAIPQGAEPLIAIVGIAALAATFIFGRDLPVNVFDFAGFVLFSSALLILGLRREHRSKPIPALVTLGDASYAIYLLHMFVVGAVVGLGYRLLPVDDPWANVAVIGACTVISVGGGILVHRYIEKPMLAWLRGLTPKPRTKPAPRPDAPLGAPKLT